MVKETANEMVKETAVEKSDGDSDSDVQIISVHEINKNSGSNFLREAEEARVKRRKMAATLARQTPPENNSLLPRDPSNLSPQTSSGNKDGHHKKSDSECATILPKFIKKQEDSNEQKSNTGGAHLVDSHTEEKNPSSDSRARSKIRLLADLSEGSVLHPTTSNVNVDTVTLESLVGSADLLETYQFNFSVDVPLFLSFLHENFTRDRRKIVFITGNTVFDSPEMKSSIQKRLDISEAIAPLPNRFASHHTKMMVNFFENGEVEIAIMTCNLTTLDISGLTQALWRSGRMGKGPTTTTLGKRFRFDLLRYFSRYGLSVTRRLMSALEKVDFSSVDVELVASAPGVYDVKSSSVTGECYGYAKLRQVLERNDLLIKDTSPKHNILSQVTSIAYPYTSHKGNTSSVFSHILCPLMFEEWSGDLSPGAQAFENHQQMYNYAPHIIFPTKRDVAQSNLGYLSGAAVHFKYEGSAAHKAQYEQNIKKYLYKWSHSGNATGREHITPHVKYYACDNGDDWRSLKWVMVGSHNLSKQAWGYPKPKTGGTKMDVSSYELSVLVPSGKQKLVPTYGADTLESYKGNPVRFPFLLPPTPYGSTDLPWSTESTCGSMKDRWGNSYP